MSCKQVEQRTLRAIAYKAMVEKRTGLKLKLINNNIVTGGYVAGKKYYSGYWGEVDECIEIRQNSGGWAVKVKGQDGEFRVHFTNLDLVMDFEVIENG